MAKVYVEDVREAADAALAIHTIQCVRVFCGVVGRSPDRWVQDRGFGTSVGDEETFLANLRLLAETTDCPCRSGKAWKAAFGRDVDLPFLD